MSYYPPGVTSNEPQIAGEPECPECGTPVSMHPMRTVEDRHGYDYEVWGECPTICSQCDGAGERGPGEPCENCNGTGLEPES